MLRYTQDKRKVGKITMTLDNGYELKTTFWQDFTIADHFGLNAIKDTYKRAMKEWKNNTEYITEISIVLNLKIWQHYESHNDSFATLYDSLWKECEDYIFKHFDKKALRRYCEITD